ncbi:MAG: hypothetical protein JWQ71_2721, partial [Pedosphaera sp.]|nr:hypothetical protein [Pedosphaera sp.]
MCKLIVDETPIKGGNHLIFIRLIATRSRSRSIIQGNSSHGLNVKNPKHYDVIVVDQLAGENGMSGVLAVGFFVYAGWREPFGDGATNFLGWRPSQYRP